MMMKRTTLVHCLLAAFGGGAAVLASAQAPAPSAEPQELERVTITGSNIRRTAVETTSPVQVLTAENLKASGYTSVQDVLHNLTANGQGTLSQGFGLAFAEGASGIALRGLTVSSTLVLVDGKRIAPYPIGDDGQRSFVDISNIPFDAIEKVEVLKDGASAVYGSDAIAGVVNIILKRKYVGATVNADAGVSKHNDGQTYGVSGIWGVGDLEKDGHNFYISAEARKQQPIWYSGRGMTSRDFTSSGGYDLSMGAITPFNSNPFSLTGYITDSAEGTTNTSKYFMPGCDQAALSAKKCTFQDSWSLLQPPMENYNVVGKYTRNLTSDWRASITGSYFERKIKIYGAPQNTSTSGFQGITSGPGIVPAILPPVAGITIPSSNPVFPQSARDAGLTNGTLYYNFLNVLGPRITTVNSKTSRIAADVVGQWGSWDVDAAVGYSQIKLDLTDRGLVNPSAVQDALNDSTFAPGQATSGDVLSRISPTLYRNDKSSLWYAHLGAGTELATLPGGALSMAFGVDYYERKQDARAPAQIAAGVMSGVGNNFTVGEQQVGSVYAELAAPVTKPLELDAAVRYDHYNISGGKASPKIGFKFTPIKEVLLRGTASKGFRAPGPSENGNSGQTFVAGSSNDPVLCANGDPTAAGNFPGQCGIHVGSIQSTSKSLKPETSTALTLGLIVEPIKELSFSFDFYQIELKGQIVPGGDSVLVRGTNFAAIPQVQADGSIINVVPPVAPIAYQTGGYINANSTKVGGVDIGSRYKYRIDGMGDYKTEFMWSLTSKYDLTINGVTYKLAGTHGPFVISGNTGNPKSRIQWSHTLGSNDWSMTGTLNHISSFDLTDPSFSPDGTDASRYDNCYNALNGNLASTIYNAEYSAGRIPKATSCKVASFTTFDLYARYDLTKNLSVHGSVTNLFGRKYPADWNTYASQTYAPYNPSMHSAGAIGRFFNIGARYNF